MPLSQFCQNLVPNFRNIVMLQVLSIVMYHAIRLGEDIEVNCDYIVLGRK